MYQSRPTLVDQNSDKTFFYSFTVSTNKCGASCNFIYDPCAQICVSDKAKNMNVKVFNVRVRWNKICSWT